MKSNAQSANLLRVWITFRSTSLLDCLHMAFVMSPIACGTLEAVDPSKALAMDGVVGYIDASDVPRGAKLGHHSDTPIFVQDEVTKVERRVSEAATNLRDPLSGNHGSFTRLRATTMWLLVALNLPACFHCCDQKSIE